MEHLPPSAAKIVQEGITFDDVLLIPQFSRLTPDQADTSSRLTRNIRLNIPLVSAPMDTVTEAQLAIALAQEGGIGIIHKNMPPEAQAREVAKVKRSENGVITDPVTLSPSDTIARAITLMAEQNVSGFPVTADGSRRGKVVGILTRRDMKFVDTRSGGGRNRTIAEVLGLARELRDADLRVEYALAPQAVGKQLKLADTRGARVAIVVGPDDRARGEVMVKDLRRKGQVPVARAAVREHVAKVVRGVSSP